MESNRCPQCGGVAKHLLTDVKGDCYYHCTTGLTSFGKVEDGELSRVGRIESCDTLIDSKGKLVNATLAFVRENELKTIRVSNGKIL